MPVEEIVEDIYQGIKLSVQKGYSLRQAMMSFYNAGYSKEDIEAAAQKFQMHQNQMQLSQQKKTTEAKQELSIKKLDKTKSNVQESKTVKQEVSNYEKPQKPKNNMKWIILFIVVGILLIASLAALFIFL